MLKDLLNDFRFYVKDRISKPLYPTFIFAFLIHNWKLIFWSFSHDMKTYEKIFAIEHYIKNDPYKCIDLLVYPFLWALIVLVIFPVFHWAIIHITGWWEEILLQAIKRYKKNIRITQEKFNYLLDLNEKLIEENNQLKLKSIEVRDEQIKPKTTEHKPLPNVTPTNRLSMNQLTLNQRSFLQAIFDLTTAENFKKVIVSLKDKNIVSYSVSDKRITMLQIEKFIEDSGAYMISKADMSSFLHKLEKLEVLVLVPTTESDTFEINLKINKLPKELLL